MWMSFRRSTSRPILGPSNDFKEKTDVSILGILSGCHRLQLNHHRRVGIEREEVGSGGSTAWSWPAFEACAGCLRRRVGFFCRASEGQVRSGGPEDRSGDPDP